MFQVLCAATKFAQKIDELALKPEFWLNWVTMHMRHYGVKDFLKLKGKKQLERSWNAAENKAETRLNWNSNVNPINLYIYTRGVLIFQCLIEWKISKIFVKSHGSNNSDSISEIVWPHFAYSTEQVRISKYEFVFWYIRATQKH